MERGSKWIDEFPLVVLGGKGNFGGRSCIYCRITEVEKHMYLSNPMYKVFDYVPFLNA